MVYSYLFCNSHHCCSLSCISYPSNTTVCGLCNMHGVSCFSVPLIISFPLLGNLLYSSFSFLAFFCIMLILPDLVWSHFLWEAFLDFYPHLAGLGSSLAKPVFRGKSWGGWGKAGGGVGGNVIARFSISCIIQDAKLNVNFIKRNTYKFLGNINIYHAIFGTHTKKCVIYLKFKLIWASVILSGNPILKTH